MTITPSELALYSGALLILFLTPGPVWVALVARAMSGGFNAAWPLALGVVVGDVLWPLLAIFGVSLVASVYGDFLTVLRWVAAIIFVAMGVALLRHTGNLGRGDSKLTRPGMWAGFIAGLLVILGNPKAILFYMGILPGFFDLGGLTGLDIAVICAASAIVPLVGNLLLAASFDHARQLLASPSSVRQMTVISGLLLIAVGIAIPFT